MMFELELKVLPVSQPIGEFFISSISAENLVEIAFADVRRLTDSQRKVEKYLGIQRPLSKKRVKDIKKYIEGSDATFPTAVIVAVDENCAVYDEAKGKLILSAFEPDDDEDGEAIPWERIANVLDGQHRIAAFMDEDSEYSYAYDHDFEINLAIFIGADISEQASIFATVNLAQTKVNRSLVYDLTELAKTRSPHKTCHNVAVALDTNKKSPLFQRIKRLGTKTPGREKEPLTQAAFVESLVRFISVDPVSDRNKLLDGKKPPRATPDELKKVPFRNMFLDKQDVEIAEIIFNYFSAVRKKWPESWENLAESGNLLPKSNAFKALMKFLREDAYLKIVGDDVGKVPSAKKFEPFFEDIDVRDSDFSTKNFVPGSGGQSMFLKMLRKEITRKDMLE
jgi:DGQHR domain-containing protein